MQAVLFDNQLPKLLGLSKIGPGADGGVCRLLAIDPAVDLEQMRAFDADRS